MSEVQGAGVIAGGKDYELATATDGASFLLRSKADGLVAHLTGDDAARFQAEYDVIRLQYPAWTPDQTLAQLWDHGGYSWLAAEEGE
jgi:hypothetical protein